jgi:hypothetical protein
MRDITRGAFSAPRTLSTVVQAIETDDSPKHFADAPACAIPHHPPMDRPGYSRRHIEHGGVGALAALSTDLDQRKP